MPRNNGMWIGIGVVVVAIIILTFSLNLQSGGAPGSMNATFGNGTKPTIAVSFNPIYYLVRPVVGNHVNIQEIVAPGVEPHGYEPTPKDILGLSEATVLFYDSPLLENWAVQLVQATNRKIELAPLINAINYTLIDNDTSMIASNPHFWLDPALMPSVVFYIRNKMIATDPANASYYNQSADKFIVQLNQLNLAYRRGLAHCQSRVLMDSHAFLGYIAISYNLTEWPIGGLTPDTEPSAAKVAGLIANGTEAHVHAVFQESADSTVPIAAQIAQSINATTYKIYTMEILTPKQLNSGVNYTSLMYQNLKSFEEGLNCT